MTYSTDLLWYHTLYVGNIPVKTLLMYVGSFYNSVEYKFSRRKVVTLCRSLFWSKVAARRMNAAGRLCERCQQSSREGPVRGDWAERMEMNASSDEASA